jgi:hypothetical protein
MTQKVADKWFNDVDFTSIVSTVKGIMTSDGSISILLDFERVLDESDLYAFKNWLYGELVQGPDIGRYSVTCTFMWPYKLMPDPRGAKRLLSIGCDVDFDESKIRVPVEVKNYDDFIQGTNYPKSTERKVWFVKITIPLELMDDIKEGSIDLADQTIDLNELDEAYDEDLDKQSTDETETNNEADSALAQDFNLGPPAPTGI